MSKLTGYLSLFQNMMEEYAEKNSVELTDFRTRTKFNPEELLYSDRKQLKKILRFIVKNRGFQIQELFEYIQLLISKREYELLDTSEKISAN